MSALLLNLYNWIIELSIGSNVHFKTEVHMHWSSDIELESIEQFLLCLCSVYVSKEN